MNNLSFLVKDYAIRFELEIKRITDPLKDFLNISTYLYFRIDEDGRFVTLSNYPEQLEFYYEEKFYLNNPYLVHPSLLRSGNVLTSTTKDKEYLETIEQSRCRFGLDHTFLMLEKGKREVEGFFFGARSNEFHPNAYFERLDALKKFNFYFLKEAALLLGKMKAEGGQLDQAKGAKFFERAPGLPLADCDQEENAFLKAIFPLSPQERRCFELYRQGHSAQATGAIMGISPRTVEHYFESILRKLGCHSKRDLLRIG